MRRRGPVPLGVPGAVLDLHAGLYLPLGISAPPVPLVPSWPDVSGSGNNVTQAVAAMQGTHVPGPGVSFDQVNDTMGTPNVIPLAASDWTIFAVITRAIAVGQLPFVCGFTVGNTGLFVGGTLIFNWGLAVGAVLDSGEVLPAGRHLLCATKAGVTYTMFRDGNPTPGGPMVGPNCAIDAFRLNCEGDQNAVTFGGHTQHRLVIYPSSLVAADRNLVSRRLKEEWAIP